MTGRPAWAATPSYRPLCHALNGENRQYLLKKALDSSKDQSYVLYMLTQKQLAHTQFPLGALHKAETRQLADSLAFNARKPDSQDVCFVPDGDMLLSSVGTPEKRTPR